MRMPRAVASIGIGLVLVLLGACTFNGEKAAAEQRIFLQHARSARDAEKSTESDVRIGEFGIKMARGRFLLARKGIDLCAFKFTEFYVAPDPEHEPGQMPFFYAGYELYHQGRGGANFATVGSKPKHITLGMNPFIGGHGVMRPDPGPTSIRCGDMRLRWWYPTFVRMGPSLDPKLSDPDVELAPTPWTEIREVDATDRHVKWYRYEPNRPVLEIRVDEMWK